MGIDAECVYQNQFIGEALKACLLFESKVLSLNDSTELQRLLGGQRGACALVAIKDRARCKTRLADSLEPSARIQLARSMLSAVLSAADDAQTIRQIIVVSPERDSVPAEIPVLADTGECLNGALTQAYRLLRKFGWREVVILPADLPTITASDIDILVRVGRRGGFAIAPDTAGTGTNALCISSGHPFRFQFGFDSRRRHVLEAERIGLKPSVVHLAGLQFDVDSAFNLRRLKEQQWHAQRQA